MQITDLSYLESISMSDSIYGGVLVAVDAYAGAIGDATFTDAYTVTKARQLPNGGSIGFGRGRAVAVGDAVTAGVSVYGEGDKVIEKTKVRYFPNKDMVVARGFVIAIDRPN